MTPRGMILFPLEAMMAMAAALAAALPAAFVLESAEPCALAPPPDCPYVSPDAGDALVVAVVAFSPPSGRS